MAICGVLNPHVGSPTGFTVTTGTDISRSVFTKELTVMARYLIWHGNILSIIDMCVGKPPYNGRYTAQREVMQIFIFW